MDEDVEEAVEQEVAKAEEAVEVAWAAPRPVQGRAAAASVPTADTRRHIRWACLVTK